MTQIGSVAGYIEKIDPASPSDFAIAMIKQAVERHPDYAPAHSMLVQAGPCRSGNRWWHVCWPITICCTVAR